MAASFYNLPVPEPRTDPKTTARVPRLPHAPEGGWSRRLLGAFHVTGVFWYRFHRWGMHFLPSSLVGVAVAIFTTLFFVCLRKIRAAIAANLEPVLGPCGWWQRQLRIYRTMWTFAWCLSERYERLSTDRSFQIEPEAVEHWAEVAREGRGFVMVTAHLGGYEVGSMMPAQMERRHVHLVREPEADARAQAFIQSVVTEFTQAQFTMHFESDDPLQGLVLLDALRRGDIVAVQGDRPRGGAKTVNARLFGRPFALPAGPAALARAADVSLLPAFIFREGRRRYRAVFRPPIRPLRSADRAGDLTTAMQRVAADLEWAIRQAPYQWFCFRRLWP
jgi:KDO2-lipid IV(A) lauroyltransferase